MASWKRPAVLNKMLEDIPGINTLLNALLKQDPAGTTDVPAGAKRWADTADGKQMQVWNGSSWSSVGKLDHDVASVDGKSVSVSVVPDTIPVRDASGKLPGDITGNAATASEAAALSEVNPIPTGGTGGTTAAEARENLVVPPKNHASSSTDYGLGTSRQYGHTKPHDEPDATLTADAGHAFSPAGAASLKTDLEGQIGDVETGASQQVSALDSTLRALIEEEVGEAESAASQQVAGLDATLRALIAEEVAKCLKIEGGPLTGRITSDVNMLVQVTRNSSGDTYVCTAENTLTGNRIRVGLGATGANRGIYDDALSGWLIALGKNNNLFSDAGELEILVDSYKEPGKWGFKFKGGLLVQGGVIKTGSAESFTKVNFPFAFVNYEAYGFSGVRIGPYDVSGGSSHAYVCESALLSGNRQTSSINVFRQSATATQVWIAVGYWS